MVLSRQLCSSHHTAFPGARSLIPADVRSSVRYHHLTLAGLGHPLGCQTIDRCAGAVAVTLARILLSVHHLDLASVRVSCNSNRLLVTS